MAADTVLSSFRRHAPTRCRSGVCVLHGRLTCGSKPVKADSPGLEDWFFPNHETTRKLGNPRLSKKRLPVLESGYLA